MMRSRPRCYLLVAIGSAVAINLRWGTSVIPFGLFSSRQSSRTVDILGASMNANLQASRMGQHVLSNGTSVGSINVLTATAQELQQRLSDGRVTSLDLVQLYLTQIEKHNHQGLKLHAVISTAPPNLLTQQAKQLDRERASGHVRSSLHGIPILVKDNIMTESALGMDTTCGSLAFDGVEVKKNAPIIDLLLKAGMIILGKANLSEWAGKKGYCITTGWSAKGGQTQTPYVVGGVQSGEKCLGHSTPCGSSSGSAAGVAAGFAPLSLGTETDGSVTQPAGRASLYAMKVTVGSVSTQGTSPYGNFSDSLGPMAKTPEDLAALLGVLMDKDFLLDLTTSWEGQKIAFVNPDDWELGEVVCYRDEALLKKQRTEIRDQISQIEASGAMVVRDVWVPKVYDFDFAGRNGLEGIWDFEFKDALRVFLEGYSNPEVKTLEDLVRFNNEHKGIELPSDQPNPQNQLTDALGKIYTKEEYEDAKEYIRGEGKSAFDKIFTKHGVDVVAGPLDGRIVSTAACAGYPVGVVPLGYAPETHGRAYGLTAVAAPGQEGKLVQFMSAWATQNEGLWQPPPLLVKWDHEAKHNL